jgi:thioredoxin family protein
MATATNHIVRCPACGTGNRVPGEKEGLAGKCGSCHAGLPPLYTRPQMLDERSFDPFVNAYPGPVLVEFWAPW